MYLFYCIYFYEYLNRYGTEKKAKKVNANTFANI